LPKRTKPKSTAGKALLDVVIEAAEEKLALDIKVLDLAKGSPVWDQQIIMSAESKPQLTAITDNISEKLIKAFPNFQFKHAQGHPDSGWIILDLGDIAVHVLLEDVRKQYSLEEIWEQPGVIFHY